MSAVAPVELLLQQVQASVQLVALLSAQAVQRRVEGWRRGHAAAGDLLVLAAAPSILSPETEDVGHARKGACGGGEGRRDVVGPAGLSGVQRGCLTST